ncbi:hypothetical protein [endosymbiont of unidentified scaly snail isolate Monju]|uniref:hypothetical protein n=1 Tax=endosymbiont of unidentified scaly snail isolate Monju TaxID=1248727 RepID=UPI000389281B|nr:hypothetical protein [endosymbiont of unidentified scaly snail isolate Monju]BAN68959.1 conserved hypothetical protein [endosymbiont of unidentified scaly snail isolate Monju]
MNIFVLNSGRCGSTTWIRACEHMHNYTAGHESRAHLVGPARLTYPENHIEADNRLSWLLGRLDATYGKQALYVHLRRDPETTAQSFARRHDFGIMKAYREGILIGADPQVSSLTLARDYLETVEHNIALFLRDKPHVVEARLEYLEEDFLHFWSVIGAEGDLDAALAELRILHNSS